MKTNHETRLINYLNQYGSITTLEAIRDLGNTRLSAYIYNLRKKGHNITSENIKVPTRFKDNKGQTVFTSVAKYKL
tara:strand:+ start:312 stop:539 length:228 start_codon:yes stop_codon:yes gene_type:complete